MLTVSKRTHHGLFGGGGVVTLSLSLTISVIGFEYLFVIFFRRFYDVAYEPLYGLQWSKHWIAPAVELSGNINCHLHFQGNEIKLWSYSRCSWTDIYSLKPYTGTIILLICFWVHELICFFYTHLEMLTRLSLESRELGLISKEITVVKTSKKIYLVRPTWPMYTYYPQTHLQKVQIQKVYFKLNLLVRVLIEITNTSS